MLRTRKIEIDDVEITTNADWEREYLPRQRKWYRRVKSTWLLACAGGSVALYILLKLAYMSGFSAGTWRFW